MSVPPWMMPPPEPHPESGGDWFPHIIHHEIVGDGTVLVTWALPGLRNATVRVPLAAWLQGDHHPTGAFLGTFVKPLIPDPRQTPAHPPDEQYVQDGHHGSSRTA